VCAIAFLLIGARQGLTQTANNTLAFERVSHLRRGININRWFALAPNNDYSPNRLMTYMTADDLRRIHELGFDHVRLSIDATPLLASSTAGGLR
jgi:hypothetical protein